MKPLQTIILAAGKGVRMKSSLPKVLHPVCGRAMIQYVIELAQSLRAQKTFVVLGHQNEAVKNVLPKNVEIVIQKKLLGTADAIESCRRPLGGYRGDILILCGDTPLLQKETLKKLLQKHQAAKSVCTFLTACVDSPSGYGRVIRDSEGAVCAIREDGDATSEEKAVNEINTGVYCFQGRELFEGLREISVNRRKKEFYLTDIIHILVDKGKRVETLTTPDSKEALGVNTRQDLALAQDVVRKKILEHFMRQGVTITAPETTYIDSGAQIGQDTVIRPFTVIEGRVRIGKNCIIGPFCHIRPDSVIGDNVEVGNFAEISRASLGSGSFMKHFSFLGDTQAGKRVNIGAGVVTANFDGKTKHETTISDDAFIGSDSILVAPVKIGKGAVTGAGSVVTKGTAVPDGGIALGVPAKIKGSKRIR